MTGWRLGFAVGRSEVIQGLGQVKSNIDSGAFQAVQVAGPSGSCIAPNEFGRELSYEDLATGGSLIIIGKQHDLLKVVVHDFIDFFVKDVPVRVIDGWMVVEPEILLTFYSTIHSSKFCCAMQN